MSAFAIAGSFVIGIVLGAARAHRIPVVSQLTAVYVEVIRNTPILVQIFLIFFGLPQFGIILDQFTVAWLSVMVWGGAFNSENFRAGFGAVSHRHREAALALGFGPLRDIPQRDAADRRADRAAVVDQHLHLRRQEHLADVRDRLQRADDDGAQHQHLTLQTTEALTVLGVVYLALVWSLSAAIRLLEARLALPEAARCSPDWVGPVAHYILHEGLPGPLQRRRDRRRRQRVIGIVLGTLMTIDFRPLRALIRLYIEIFRGLPILVTVFLVFFGLPTISPALEFRR